MIKEHFLYSTIIEGDGHLRREPTVAGCAIIAFTTAICFLILGYIALVLIAFL